MHKLYRAYFAVALLLGFHKHVLRVSNCWGSASPKIRLAKLNAAYAATQMLIDDGYHRCPSCYWAIETKDEHVNVVGSFCHDEQLHYLRRQRREGKWLPPESVAQLATLRRIRRERSYEDTLH
ncbi:MAG: hypothetical protein JWM39_598 [Parcubacteria group bacterium]|nr:hypothetical protein [Parcubacteria group bacterium]